MLRFKLDGLDNPPNALVFINKIYYKYRALIANEHSWAGNQFSNLKLAFATKRAVSVFWKFVLSPYPARAGCTTAARGRRMRLAPSGRMPAFSWS